MNQSKVLVGILLSLIAFAPSGARALDVDFENDASIPLVHLNVAIKAGAAHDPIGQSGISNFMGEMLLRGTTGRSKEKLDRDLDQIGASVEVEVRAEALILRTSVLSSKLPEFLEIMTDILAQPSFRESEIRKLKTEIISGIMEEQGRDSSLARTRWDRFLFEGHPYGKPILGKIRDIERLSRVQILEHYHRFFQDRLLLVVGSGDSEASFIESWSKRVAEKAPNRVTTFPVELVPEPKAPARKRVEIVDKPERTQTQVYAGQIGVRMTDDDFFPLYLGNHAFGGGSFSARLMTEIRVKKGWSYGANSYFRHGRRPRSWQMFYFPAAKDTPDALATGLRMIEDLKKNGLSAEEFQFAQSSLVNSAGFMYNTPAKRVENTLLERTLDLPRGFMKTYGEKLGAVTLPRVNAALKAYLQPDRLSILVLGTAKQLREGVAKAAGVDPKDVQVVGFKKE